MTITGLSSDLYYMENPILVNITALTTNTNYINITLTNQNDGLNPIISNTLRLYPNVSNEIINLDLSEYIKGNFPRPQHPTSPINDDPINTNYVKFSINFTEVLTNGSSASITTLIKTFLRGGTFSQSNNITAQVGDVLKETDNILVWGSLPRRKYYIDASKRIYSTNIIPDAEVYRMKELGCDPFYVRFRNTKGGYSYWYFPTYEISRKIKSDGFVNKTPISDSFSLGNNIEIKYNCESKIKEENYALARALMSSSEIHAYDKFGVEWALVEIQGGKFQENNFDSITELNATFGVPITKRETVLW